MDVSPKAKVAFEEKGEMGDWAAIQKIVKKVHSRAYDSAIRAATQKGASKATNFNCFLSYESCGLRSSCCLWLS